MVYANVIHSMKTLIKAAGTLGIDIEAEASKVRLLCSSASQAVCVFSLWVSGRRVVRADSRNGSQRQRCH